MSDLYNRIDALCKERGTNITALCRDAKVARASLSELKAGRTKTLTLETGAKLAAVLKISVDELMGTETKKAPTPEDERVIDDRKMKAAFLGGLADGLSDEEIDEYWDDARDYIGYKIQQKKNKPD